MLLFVKTTSIMCVIWRTSSSIKFSIAPTIITAQIDPLRSEGKAYANLLQQAVVVVRYKNYEGVTPEFFGMAAVVDKAKEAQQFVRKV